MRVGAGGTTIGVVDPAAVAARRAAHAEAGLDLADLDADPVAQFRRWWDEVHALDLPEPTAVVLATAPAGPPVQPLSRHVLLKGVDERGFWWVTNTQSRKGRHLSENPLACMTFPWAALGRQVNVWGPVEHLDAATSDAYFASRPRGSQLAAWASEQSRPVPDRAWIERRWAELAARYEGVEVPRPPHWGGLRLVPDAVELWQERPFRMHDRFLYERAGAAWAITRLCP